MFFIFEKLSHFEMVVVDDMDFYPYPEKIDKKLSNIYFQKITEFYTSPVYLNDKYKSIKQGSEEKSFVQSGCASCKRPAIDKLKDHPIFQAKMCQECFVRYNDLFSIDIAIFMLNLFIYT